MQQTGPKLAQILLQQTRASRAEDFEYPIAFLLEDAELPR